MVLIARQVRHPSGHLTTIRLTPQAWELIADIIRRNGVTRDQLVARAYRRFGGGLSAALRAYVATLMLERNAECEREIAELRAEVDRLKRRLAECEAALEARKS